MKFLMSDGQILRDYRGAKDKKAQIGILADLNLCQKRDIAQFLHDHGEEVDGRLLRGPSKRSPSRERERETPAPEPAAETQHDTPEHCEVAAAPTAEIPASVSDPDTGRSMTAGVLAALLAKVDPAAPVWLDGEGFAGWIHVSVMYDAHGEQTEAEITIHPMHQ